MEHVVAVAVTLDSGEERLFITWGRVQHVADPTAVEQIVLKHSANYGLGATPVAAEIRLLRDARDPPYFFEALWQFSQTKVPTGRRYERWRRSTDRTMRDGGELYFLGSD